MRSFIILPLIVISLTIFGCSSSGDKGPLQVGDNPVREYNVGNGHSVIGCGNLVIEPGVGEILIIPNRAMEAHLNVTGMLNDPKCPGSKCLKLYLWKYDSKKSEYWIDVYVLNPTALSPWDPRMILLTSEVPDDFDVRNADSWVTLFDNDDYPDNRNPFIAMAKDDVNNRRLPTYPLWDTETLVLWINPDKEPTSSLSYIFEVNWPGHCREPYEISNIEFIEPYYKLWRNPPTYEDSFSIACNVFDWQGDAIEVSFYAPDIFGDEEWRALAKDTDLSYPNRWKADFEDIDTKDIKEGWYKTWFVALSGPPTDQVDRIYQRFDFPVFHYDETGTGGGPTPKEPRIAFLRDKTGYADIYIKDLWLGGMEYLLINPTSNPTWNETEEYRPAISPDGQWVVFASDHGDQIDLWRVSMGGAGIPAKITDTWADDFGPRFNPKSSDPANPDIIFYSYMNDNNAEIYKTQLFPTLPPTRITFNNAEDVDPCYSPDGKWIAFASNRLAWNNYEIFVYNLTTFEIYRITYDQSNDVRPSWSPGKNIAVSEIAFQTDRNGDYDIYKFMVTTSETVPLVRMDADQVEPCYSPDGSSVIFAWNEGEYFNLYTIPWDGNKEFLFKRTSTNVDNWSPYWGAI